MSGPQEGNDRSINDADSPQVEQFEWWDEGQWEEVELAVCDLSNPETCESCM